VDHRLATAACAFSVAGTMGNRNVLSHLPMSDIAYLIGAGLRLDEQVDVQRRKLVLQLSAVA